MSGVNVLAVLDELADDMGDTPGTTGDQVAQVRAAVAELFEVADEAYAELVADSARDGPRCLLLTRLEATLSRCRGGAA